MSLAEERNLEERYVMHTFARKPVEAVSGKGMHVIDDAGRDYLDFIAGIGVCSLGHCHPAVVGALTQQAEKLIHVSNYYYIEGRGNLAHTVSDLLNTDAPADAPTWKTFFANSGAEANECAIKLARLHSKKHGGGSTVITLDGSFHGRTMLTLAATAQPAKQEAFKPLPTGFLHVPINDIAALEAAFKANGGGICAVMVEPIQGESGVHPATAEFLQAAQTLAHDNDALLICDEVQTGIYRTGKPFAFQHFGIRPDIVSMAKGIAGGFPMGACAATARVADAFEPGDHGSTFGGSNLAVAAATATLAALAAEHIGDNVDEVGAYLRSSLSTLDGVASVRGLGLMCACDLDDDLDAPSIVAAGLDAGLLLNATGPHTLRFLPPLICTTGDIDVLIGKLDSLLKA